jgi:hypothetical protein
MSSKGRVAAKPFSNGSIVMPQSIEMVTWKIVGTKPLMTNNPQGVPPREPGMGKKRAAKETLAPLEEATQKLYRENGRIYVPTRMFWKAMILACPNINFGDKASSGIVPKAVEPAEEEFWLCDPDTLGKKKIRYLGEKDWMIDSRAAINKLGKAPIAVIVHRPKFRKWGGLLTLEVDRDRIPEKFDSQLTVILNEAGAFGIGSGRKHKEGSEWFSIGMGKFVAELY